MKIILDTNFLVDCIRFKIDFYTELAGNELFVLDSIIEELERIVKRKTNESILARIALRQAKDLKVLKSKEKDTDLDLINYSNEGYKIATSDRKLKQKLKGKVIYIRQKKYLIIE